MSLQEAVSFILSVELIPVAQLGNVSCELFCRATPTSLSRVGPHDGCTGPFESFPIAHACQSGLGCLMDPLSLLS